MHLSKIKMQNNSIETIFAILHKEVKDYPVPVVDLIKAQTNDPFKILISTILSARTKDETTVAVSARLFKTVTSFQDIENTTEKQLTQVLYPVGFYKTKAKNLKKLPQIIKEQFNNKIPDTIDELITLPGVGRKTANLVRAVAFNKPAICVDTHVHRIMNRIGYVQTKTPLETETALRKKLPKELWIQANRIFVAFGQQLCTPISPHCSTCPIDSHCKRINVVKSR